MLKNILSVKGATPLSSQDQKSIQGGKAVPQCDTHADCPAGGCWYCINNRCKDYCW